MDQFAYTKKSKVFTESLSTDWEFEHFDVDTFEQKNLLKYQHDFIKYFIYQQQLKGETPYIHGLIRFYTPHKYGCVLLLIGKCDYCNIRKTNNPLFIMNECRIHNIDKQPIESGPFKIDTNKVIPDSIQNSIKKDVNITRPNVDISFAEYLLKQSSLSAEDKKLVPVLYKYYNDTN